VNNPAQMMKYWVQNSSFPWPSHDSFMLHEIMRWGKLEPGFDVKGLIGSVSRVDLWRDAAKGLGVAAADIPTSDSRGIEKFFDGKIFDPADPMSYLKSQPIKRMA
jgi:nitrate/nitrite transport system substrate-binding protein